MVFNIPKEVYEILTVFEKAGFEIYIVGGAVRDFIMGKIIVDWDYTTDATPEQITALFKNAFYNNQFGTVTIPSQDIDLKPHEITTYRSEHGYSDRRRPDEVNWGKSLVEDLKRRDFTINAMAIGMTKNTELKAQIFKAQCNSKKLKLYFYDPYNGKKDLEQKLIRAVGEANERFLEDALRIMRAVRIASELNFKIEPTTLNAIQSSSTLINKISGERIRDELFKILSSGNPGKGISLLDKTELLEKILPELKKTFGVEQKSPQRHHIYDVGTHLIKSLNEVQTHDPVVRLAALIHDIGKPHTLKVQDNNVITFYNHEVVGAKIAKQIADRLKLSKKQKDKLWRLVRWHQFTVDESQTDSAIRRFIVKVGTENLEDILDLRRADRIGSGASETSWRTEEFKKRLIEVQKQPFTVHDLKITGHDVMEYLQLKPGPEIGKILYQLFTKVENKEIPNDKEALLNKLSEFKKL